MHEGLGAMWGTGSHIRVDVCSLAEMPIRVAGAHRVLSLVDPGTRVPGFEGAAEHLILRFHDVDDRLDGSVPPEAGHVNDILAFADGVPPGGRLLIHCHAGISRSPAAACIVAAAAGGVGAARAFLARHGECLPNARMIAFGDEALGLGGELVRMVEDYDREVGSRMIGQPTF